MLNVKSKNKFKGIGLLIFIVLLFCIAGFYYNKHNACKLINNLHFATAIPIEVNKTKGMKNLKCKLYYNNKIRVIESTYFEDEPLLGNKYFIAFNKRDFNSFIVFTNYPVSDSIKSSSNGWSRLPIVEYQNIVKEYLNEKTNQGIYKYFPSCN